MPAAHNAEYMKKYNRSLVMKLLIRQPMSRAELAKRTGLTRQTLTVIAEELLAEQLVTEEEQTGAGKGRTPILLKLKSDAYYAIGVYLSRSGCRVGLVNIRGEIVRLERIADGRQNSVNDILQKIAEAVTRLAGSTGIAREKILGVGISSPGPVYQEQGMILNPPGFERWHDVDIVAPLREAAGLRTLLENNAYSLATYEKSYGNGKDLNNFMLLLVDSGVGCGIISNGQLYKGTHRLSGEIGHTSINFFGERCSCGNYGCLELYAAIPNLLSRYSLPRDSWQTVVEQARGGDEAAKRILYQEADYLVAGIVNAVNMLDVEAVILDGDILTAFDLLAPYMEKEVNSKIITRSFGTVALLPSCGHEHHQVAAAANIVFNHYFIPENR